MQVPGIIKNTGIVNAGFNRYLIDGFKIGIPPTDAMLMKKNPMLTNIKQKPIEYMSLLLNVMTLFMSFKKNLGKILAPMKKNTKAIIRVMVKLYEILLKDNAKNAEKIINTINGLKIWFFMIELFFKKLKKFSPGYNPLKKLLTHWSSIKYKIEKIVVNKKDLWNSSLIIFKKDVNFE